MLSCPPAMTMPASPSRICCAPSATARRPEPQSWLRLQAGLSRGTPAATAAWRAGPWPAPACSTWPSTTSSTSAAETPARSSAARMATAPRACADWLASAPLNEPTGVRAAETMTTLLMTTSLTGGARVAAARSTSTIAPWGRSGHGWERKMLADARRWRACYASAILRRRRIAAAARRKGYMAEAEQPGPASERVVIKKYANRRLYNTRSSAYVTLEHLSEMVKEGVDFVVYDAKTNEDITRQVLTQIIFDEESRGQNLLPIQFLRQLIRFYGDSMQAFVPTYLELSLDSFTRQQERLRQQIATSIGGVPSAGFFEDQVRQNFALFDRALRLFSPFAYARPEDAPAAEPEAKPAAAEEVSLDDLKRQMAEMQAQIARLASKG